MIKYTLSCLVCSFSLFAHSAESYICTETAGTGFTYDKNEGKWVQARFKPSQFLFKPLEKKDIKNDRAYGLYDVKRNLLFSCEYWFQDIGIAKCADTGNNNLFNFNRDANRFTRTSTGSDYILKYDLSAQDVPYTGIGSCIRTD